MPCIQTLQHIKRLTAPDLTNHYYCVYRKVQRHKSLIFTNVQTTERLYFFVIF
jgi:hypothetical protein